ncbi:MAG: conserved repeat domain protein [Polaromonas sp.]|nr:conserved repeat domain protein [Polaromonas sp.]
MAQKKVNLFLIQTQGSRSEVREKVSDVLFPSSLQRFVAALVIGMAMLLAHVPAQAVPAQAGTAIRNVASATYVPAGFTQVETADSNHVLVTVQAVEMLSLTQDQSVVRPPNVQVTLNHLLTNTGNVRSDYTIGFVNSGAGCPTPILSLGALRVLRDLNNNGVADAGDPVVALGISGSITLQPGETAGLLVQGTLPAASAGSACTLLTATTAATAATATNRDIITISNAAVLSLTKSASYPGVVVPGVTRIDFTVSGSNIGAQDAQPVGTAAPAGTAIFVNGAPSSLVLIRDMIPAGTQYIAGTLQTTAAGAVRLFRLPGDPAFSYRTADDAAAVEVAIGIPAGVVRNGTVALQFAVRANADLSSDIRNIAQSYYHDGDKPVVSPSNLVIIASSQSRIGVAKAASMALLNRAPNGALDGTATVRFSILLRNYGGVALYAVQAPDLLEGAGATQFGSYTPNAVPAANQYTIIPGSLVLASPNGGAAGTVAAINPEFNGTAAAQNLLAAGALLPVGGDITVQFEARINFTGRTGTLYNTVRGQASVNPGGAPDIFDDSSNGINPDVNGNGNPNDDSSPTPVATLLPALSIVKTVSLPRRVSLGVYELDYTFKVANTGQAVAPNVRVIDNLNCTFDMDKADGAIATWELITRPAVKNGNLATSASFTGRASCNRSQLSSADPYVLPTEVVLSMVDGSRPLAPGQTEEITFTVRVKEKPAFIGSRVTLANKAWAAAFDQNAVNTTPSMLVAAESNSVRYLLIDPQGTVYNAITRQPVAGAIVTYSRQSCISGAGGPVTPAEIYGSGSGGYTFNADGSVSMTTGVDGTWQFFLQSPPVTSLCTYGIGVTPPAGSGYVVSKLIPAATGSFDSCGAIVSNVASPQNGEPTTHYAAVRAGVKSDSSICESLNNHIPLDPGNLLGLVLQKDGSKKTAEFGDFIDYALTITNKTGFPVTGITFNDFLPAGFAYVANSARLNEVATANPAGGSGPSLVFSFPSLSLGVDKSATVRYRLRIGVGAPTAGDAVNRARASSGPMQSNQASWRVRVTGGVFSDEAFAFGTVHMECRRDGKDADGLKNGDDEIGIPGVRLYMEDGTSVITDIEGKWSLYGLKPITHVLRVDETTLPPGARLEVLDNRNAKNPASRFVDLKKGEFHKANFIVGNCDAPDVVQDIAARRKGLMERPDAEGEAAVRARLDPEGKAVNLGDTRALPSTGQSSLTGTAGITVPTSQALIQLPTGTPNTNTFIGGVASAGALNGTLGQAQQAGSFAPLIPLAGINEVNSRSARLLPAAQPLLQQAVPSSIELEKVIIDLDNSAGFIELKDQDTVASQTVNVRVKGMAGTQLRLHLNGQPIDERRVGKKAVLPSAKLGAWEYIGVQLKPGANTLRLDVVDDYGVTRDSRQISLVAPDKLSLIQVDVPATAQADMRTPVLVKVRLTDASGVPVTGRTQLTLETDRGRWLDEDLNPGEPGTQVFLEGGVAEYRLLPPGEPGDMRVRVSAGAFIKEVRVALLPDLRPMIGVGIIEGTLDFTKRSALALGQMPAGAAFETELSGFAGSDTASSRGAARSAFFFKGAVKGEYLLTAAYDSDKTTKGRLFRDIRPDEFYPVYGDSSVRGFDAQSTQKLYVRIDKNRSYLLYGDFTTASTSEVRQLSQSSRTLTGIKHVYETDTVRATSYASRTAQTQRIEEFPALGISGPYFLNAGNGDLLANSEKIEILVRDRNQPNIVLQTTSVARFTDYTIEPLTSRLLFTRPIASVDANLNPQSIRVTYEVDSGGAKFTVAGTDVQVKLGEKLQVGMVASTDENPENKRKLGALTAIARIGEATTLAAELVRTETDLKGTGSASRIELRHQDEKLGAVAQIAKTTASFDNPGSAFSAGRTEAVARADYKVNETTQVRGEAIYSKDALASGDRKGIAVGVQKKLGDTLMGEVGVRHGENSSPTASMFDYNQVSTNSSALGSGTSGNSVTSLGASAAAATTNDQDITTVRGRLTSVVPNLPQAQVFVEAEQDINHSDRHVLAAGGNYAITDKTRAYGRYEFISSLDGPYGLNSSSSRNIGILGVESNYMEGGRVYNEYRLADSLDGRTGQAAMGVRNTFKVSEQWRLTAGIERTKSIGGGTSSGIVGQGNSTAIVTGAEYLSDRVKASGILEARQGDDSNSYLSSLGVGYKIDTDWSLLARSIISDSKGQGANAGNNRLLSRQQIGVAYRPVNQEEWNALARYEHKTERVNGTGSALGAASGSVFGSNAGQSGTYSADIVSAHFNYNPQRGSYLMGRYAGKVSTADDSFLRSTYWAHLLQGRYLLDLSSDWDLGLQAGLLYGKGGALQKTAGVELGYQVAKDLWVSAGYNFVGLKDRDLAAGEYTSEGVYIRLRFKFDENSFSTASPAATK